MPPPLKKKTCYPDLTSHNGVPICFARPLASHHNGSQWMTKTESAPTRVLPAVREGSTHYLFGAVRDGDGREEEEGKEGGRRQRYGEGVCLWG